MMESKLKIAGAALPFPESDFEDCLAKVKRDKPRSIRLRPVMIALVIAVILCGCSAMVTESRKSGQIVRQTERWSAAEAKAEAYGITLTETMGDFTFDRMMICNMVPLDLPWIWGFVYPGYDVNNITYENPDADSTCFMAFGHIDDEFLGQTFGYENREIWGADSDYEVVKYGDLLIHTGKMEDRYTGATWLDYEKDLCFRILITGEEDPLPLAMTIIDASQ